MTKTVAITGGSSGLGRSMALQFAVRGCHILLAARRAPELHSVREECLAAGAVAVHVVVCDVSREEDCALLGQRVAELFGARLDYLVVNAGVGMRGRVDEITDTHVYRRLFDTNTLGAIYTTHYCLPHVVAAGGRIIAISSVSGLFGLCGLGGYCASKAALYGFFDALRNELHGRIHVTSVAPGFMDTGMPAKNMGPDGKPVQAHDSMNRGKAWDPDYVARTVIAAADAGTRDVSVFDMEMKE